MPAAFVSSEPTVVTIGNDVIQDGQKFTYQALPSGVVFWFVIAPWPNAAADPQTLAITAEGWADRLNSDASQPGVLSVTLAQEVTPAGNLRYAITATVESTSGRSTSQITGHEAEIFPQIFDGWVAAERERLDAIEAASPGAPIFGTGG